jgi:RNA methyltransferase, TrmH family
LSYKADETYLGTPAVLKKIIGLETDDLVAAEVALPESSSLAGAKKIIVLERLSDPGNVGTILRTALALGWDGAFITPGTADPFNDKALRAARGAPLFLPLRFGTIEELKMPLYIADVHGKNLS